MINFNKITAFLNTKNEKQLSIIAIVGICLFILIFHLFYYNKFLPPLDGWFHVLAKQIELGQIPYKDFSFCLPPFYLYKINLINGLFGDFFINMRIYGIFERCVICSLLFLSLKSITSLKYAYLGTLASFMGMTSVSYDLISSPVQSSVLCSVVVLFLWCKSIKTKITPKYYLYIFLIGFFCFCSTQYKQTTGLLLSFASLVLSCLLVSKDCKSKFIRIVTFLSGFILPAGIFYAILYKMGILSLYFHQLFIDAVGEKGGFVKIFIGLFNNNYSSGFFVNLLAFFGVLFYIKLIENKQKDCWEYKTVETTPKELILYILLSVFAVILSYITINQDFIRFNLYNTVLNITKFLASTSFIVVFIMGIFSLIKIFKNKEKTCQNQLILIYSGLSFGMLFASGMSIFFDVNVTIIATGFLIALAYNYKLPYKNVKDAIISVLVFVFIYLVVVNKYPMPYDWWGWSSESIRKSKVKVEQIQKFKHFTLNPIEAKVLNDANKLSQEKLSEPNDYLYSFPNVPLVHLLLPKKLDNISPFPHIDVYSDERAVKEAQYILNNPPKVIFYLKQTKKYWEMHEKYFRANNYAGQRKIDENINILIKNKDLNYKLYDKYVFTTRNRNKKEREILYVYYR